MNDTMSTRKPNVWKEQGLVAYRQFGVTGITCAGEAAGLERRLRQRPGVLKAMVNPVTECAYITYDTSRIDPAALVKAINAAGYGTG